jgi:hypothetical protein
MTEINSNYSPRAVLAAIGRKLRSIDLLAPIKDIDLTGVARQNSEYEEIDGLLGRLSIKSAT